MQSVTKLVTDLELQMKKIEVACELILIDDCSSDLYKTQNETVCSKHQYYELKKNIGRSKIRNLFLKYAQYEYLLFLDCDAEVVSEDFLENYIIAIENNDVNVICGGRIYSIQKPARDFMLNWKYGIKVESKPSIERSKQPNRSFMTNNFVIKKNIFEYIRFDEQLTEYGHEDTLFGIELTSQGYNILHIENPILNVGLIDNLQFLSKTEKAIYNLIYLEKKINNKTLLCKNIELINTYYSLKKYHLNFILSLYSSAFLKVFKYFLTKGFISILIFNLYKLFVIQRFIKFNK